MITFFEYSDSVVNAGMARAKLCCIMGVVKDNPQCFEHLARAERVYSIEDNSLTEIKNRNSVSGTMHISDEDELVLRLKAVLL